MKLKLILYCSTFLLLSCGSLDGDRVQFGFTFDVSNDSGVEINNAKITIGGLKNGEFVGTESYLLPTIRIREYNWESQLIAINDNRWEPNLELIRSIPSEKAYFSIELEGRNPILLYNKKNNEIVSVALSNNIIIKNDDGKLQIVIEKDTIFGYRPYQD